MITAVVAPVFHENPVPPLAVRVAISPEQMLELPEIAAVGNEFVETVMEVVSVQDPLDTITVYVVADVGETITGFAVEPVLHE